MANTDLPRGFEVHGQCLRSAPYVLGGTVYPGDAVTLNSSGLVVVAAASGIILGIALGYGVITETVLVADHPQQEISAQCDETEVNAQTFVGNCADIVATAGNSTYRTSRHELDSSGASAAQAQLQILRLEPYPGNAFGTNCKVICRINEHAYNSAGIAGV